MKLLYRITLRISLVLLVVLTGWAFFFYVAMIDEVNDEVDDSLEDYSELIIIRALAGEELPRAHSGSNNNFFLREVGRLYAKAHSGISYADSMVYIPEKEETEPARILTTIFRDADDRYYELTVSTPTIEKADLKMAILHWIIFLYVGLLLIILAVNFWVLFRSMRPLYVLLKWLDRYTIGAKNEPLKNETRITEFQKLNDAAVRNAERAEQLFEQQKQFIGNASHEIQTPLAICQNRLEILTEESSLSERDLGEVIKTLQTLEHISKLNKSLLLLTKIDNGQFSDNRLVLLNEIVPRYLDDYREVYGYKEIAVEVEDNGPFAVMMNEALAVVLITNLLKNAYIHTVAGGNIRIQVSADRFVLRNSGTGEPLDGKRVFDRFYQGSRKEGSAGLGLAIVESICRLYGLSVGYFFDRGEHCFEIRK